MESEKLATIQIAPRFLTLAVTALFWCQLSRIGPNVLWECNQR